MTQPAWDMDLRVLRSTIIGRVARFNQVYNDEERLRAVIELYIADLRASGWHCKQFRWLAHTLHGMRPRSPWDNLFDALVRAAASPHVPPTLLAR
eukprot:1469475-Lingulodinium_polyedra.AAC.1